jgi:long-chain-fatty-acid--[acyl-carrier-protein] ligase
VVVPFNWTSGASALDHAITLSGVQGIISSDVFLTQVQASFTDNTMGKVVTLEGLLAGSLSSKIGTVVRLVKGRLLARLPTWAIRFVYPYTMNADDTAVVLFTSGSESLPKGVPLSHQNVMACVRGALAAIDGKPNEVMLAFLPAFHSFGFSMEMMLCATTGVKVAYEPDPKRYRRLAAAAEKWQATLIPGTPDFIAGILDAAEDPARQFATVRAVLTGAQKAPQVLKDRIIALGKDFFEGYGITETAPLVSVTRPGETPVGVGKPIDGVLLAIVGIEPDAGGIYHPLTVGETGRIFVTGATVFGGYMGGVQNPFVNLDGVRYYNTGDLGFLDAAGNLTISGRLKRFIKVAGEMVSLPAVEDALVSRWPSGEHGPMVAIDGIENPDGGGGIICLYTADSSVTLAEAHAVLRAAGVTGISWPRYLKQVAEIPLLGTGKVNYRDLPSPKSVAEETKVEAA